MALHSSRVPRTVASSSLLLLLLAAAAGAADPAQDAPHKSEAVPARRFPVPPAPDLQQKDALAVFRLKEMRPCECENGGRCNRRVRVCECPLGFGGARCEIIDHELFAEMEADEAAKKALQQAADAEHVCCAPVSLWLVYVAAVAAAALLLLMLRAFAVLASSYYKAEKKKPLALPSAFDDGCKASDIYTLPLPPPYSERCAYSLPPLAHSTPCCAKQLLQLQLQPDYLRTLQEHKPDPSCDPFYHIV